MKIIKCVLVRYTRFDLLGIEKLTYTPESPYQLILGGNSIGKSSLLSELSPLPPDSTDLKEGGSKIIVLDHRGSSYTLSYNLHKKLDCSFVKDGKELNDGNTIKVQRDLIWEHFRYNNDIHEILLGNVKLSNMAPTQRREWFVKMSRSDMGYAIGLYNRLKSAERDVKGAIKINNQRLVSEQVKLPKEEDILKAKQVTNELHQDLNHLLPYLNRDLSDYNDELRVISGKLEKTSQSFLDKQLELSYRGIYKSNELSKYWNHLRERRYHLENQYKQSVDELAELQSIIERNRKLTERPLSEITNEIDKTSGIIKETDYAIQ